MNTAQPSEAAKPARCRSAQDSPNGNSLPAHLDDLRILLAAEAAQLLNTTVGALDHQRATGKGPPFIRLSVRRIGYRVSDLRRWLDARTERPANAA